MSKTLLIQGKDGGQEVEVVTNAALTQRPELRTEYEVASATVSYYGKAVVGTAKGSALWQIQRHTSTAEGNLSIEWADGEAEYDNIWDNRASLSYS